MVFSWFPVQAQTATNMCGNISFEASNDLMTWEVEASVVPLVNHLMIQNCLEGPPHGWLDIPFRIDKMNGRTNDTLHVTGGWLFLHVTDGLPNNPLEPWISVI